MTIESACTSVLVGQKASIDGSTMIARNDDTFLPLMPQRFYMHPAWKGEKDLTVTSPLNGFTATLPENGYRYNAVPNVDNAHYGDYEESGINEKNVAMSATESTYGNERTLALDPLVVDGLDEDLIVNMVLPFIESARHGVEYLGQLIKQYGSPAGNSVLFSDKDNVWYMEIVTGHHWVAQRIPDDAYAVAANQVAIQQVDFSDTDNFAWSEGIREFVDMHHLNPDKEGWNFRHIFGTMNEKDRHYNTPRVWYAHHILNPEVPEEPESAELPFIMHTDHLITPEDIEFILGSHYNETRFDPLGHGSDADRLRYRPIGLNRTQNSHILQLRNQVDEGLSAVMWLTLGIPEFSPYVPFYTNATDTDPSYSETPLEMDVDADSAYWLHRTLGVLVESHYSKFIQQNRDYLTELNRVYRAHIHDTDEGAEGLTGKALTKFLTEANYKIVDHTKSATKDQINQMIMQGLQLSHLTFNMDKNL
ncbi:C69 family dipeptidase [Lacticaseibacillus brantae]|uniref:Dipeptidase n=1 Tax=Lacticaseibacillus brantae DSM 23927 TaxID=1423727 RepID=A0A0R2B985_9LACO|nr:C69 family dipeptidase [Lacticaseibacillus brantae]KRM72969.1 dipeptidase [Lacticaseibacillus brantae DSM 23927]